MHAVHRYGLANVTDIIVVCVSVCVCSLVTTVSPTKTAEPIEVLFGVWNQVGLRNHASSIFIGF